MELRQTRERLAQLACSEHERDPLRQQPASHERKGPRRRAVEPMGVIDETQERLLLGGVGQQAEDRQSDQERIRRRVGGTPNSVRTRRRARRAGAREARHEPKEGRTELLNRRERELHLRLDSRRLHDPEFAPSRGRILEKGRLADSGFSMHHQHSAAAAVHAVQQPVEHLALPFAPEKLPA